MNDIFSAWDKQIDLLAMADEIKSLANADKSTEDKKDFKEVPDGTYEVSVEKMEIKESKNGNPMLSVWFNIEAGEFEKHKIFMNQVINQAFQISITNRILEGMVRGLDWETIEFSSYSQYSNLVNDIFNAVKDDFNYQLKYYTNQKGFKGFIIEDVFPLA